MRKQMKIAAVVSAAALLALGASITSFAAQKGTWKYEDGEWYCYDKNGDLWTNEFCLSNGKEFYVGDDGALVRSDWVDYDGDWYFVNSAGQKITSDWRLTTPYDDEDAEEQWYYFQATGKMTTNKKMVIKGKTYFFDSEGNMLTGWVQKNGDEYVEGETEIDATAPSTSQNSNKNTYFCDETGARVEGDWVLTYAPDVDEEDADVDDEYYYYLKSNGQVATGKQTNLGGQTYFFGVNGQMLYGWIAKTGSNYAQVWTEDEKHPVSLDEFANADVYYCSESKYDGHMSKNKWIKLWNNVDFGENDDDNDLYWFYLESSGKVLVPGTASASDYVKQKFMDGADTDRDSIFADNGDIEAVKKTINGKTYLMQSNGQMVSGFVKDTDGNMYYYGGSNDGQMTTGSATITDDCGESYKFYFGTDTEDGYVKGVGVNGAKNSKLYINGLLTKAVDDKYEVVKNVPIGEGTYDFIVNQSGSIQTSDKIYEDDGDELINAKNATFVKANGATKGSVTGYSEY